MPDQKIELIQLPDGDAGLPSVFKNEDGTPRFILPLPTNLVMEDPGIKYMTFNEGLKGGCEYQTRRFFDAHLGPEDLFIDVGAHWGLFTLTAASLYAGKLSVLAIEADPFNVTRLVKSIQLNQVASQVEVVACAMGSNLRTGKLFGGLGTMAHSIDGVLHSTLNNPDLPPPAFTVPVLTLDFILSERPHLAHKPTYLKIDVEGFELDVVSGATDLIGSGRVAALVIEKGNNYTSEPALSAFGSMLENLRNQGFKCYRFAGHNHPGPLIPYELSAEVCDVIIVSDRVELLSWYE